LVDLATLLRRDALEAAVDAATLGPRRLTTAERMYAYVQDRNFTRKRGAKTLMRILRDRFDGALQLELERMFARKLKRSALPPPDRQFRVGKRKIDFAYPKFKIAIELDGLGHAAGAVFRDDRRRQNELVLQGWLVLRFTYRDVADDWDRVEWTINAAFVERTRVG
jgi:very-short-patch-repair endonuclease